MEEVIAAAKKACCHDFIMSLPDGYETVVGEGGATLSGGEKQRVSVIRAIINRPKVIIADEPTGSLDETSGMNVMKVIIDVCHRNGSSLILITHNPKFAQMMDKKFVLNKGNLTQIS